MYAVEAKQNIMDGGFLLRCEADHTWTLGQWEMMKYPSRAHVSRIPCPHCFGVVRAAKFEDPDYLRVPGSAE